MKTYILLIFSIFIFVASVSAQSPAEFTYQTILRDLDGSILANKNVTLNLDILSDNENGPVVFTEIHTVTTSSSGLVNLKVGSEEDLSVVSWGQDKYFLKVMMGSTEVETKELLSVPYSQYAKNSAFAQSADYNGLLNLPALWDENSGNDFDGQYNSLETTWLVEDNNLYYNQGKVDINGTVPTTFGGEVLKVNGAILYNGGITDTVTGVLYYDPAGNGTFRYFNNNEEMKVIGTGTVTFNNPDPGTGDVVMYSDAIWKNRVCLGEHAYAGYDFGENIFVITNDTLRVYFYDTSNSASFPSNDWQMRFNDLQNGGDSYFSIFDSIFRTTPLKIMAGNTNQAIHVTEDAKIGIGTSAPTEKVEVAGSVSATTLIGNGTGLTGLTGATDATENTGSTTIAADSDADNSGRIEFQVQNDTKLLIDNNGNVKIGNGAPTNTFDALSIDALFDNFEVKERLEVSYFKYTITEETNPGANTLSYDVTNKGIVFFDSSIGGITIQGFQNGVIGQKITIVNKSSTAQLSFPSFSGTQIIYNPGYATYTLGQYQSVTYVFNGSYWLCQELVQ